MGITERPGFIFSNLNFTDFNLHSSDIFSSTAKIKVPGR